MPADAQRVERVRFDSFEANLATGELRKSGIRLRLHDQPFQVLAILIRRPGELVSREELQKVLWPDGTFVDFENGLNSAVNRLREALGDSADAPKFIETIPRRGYRFVGHPENIPSEGPRRGWGSRRAWAVSALAVAILCAAIFASGVPSLVRSPTFLPIHSLFVVVSALPDQDSQSAILADGASEAVIRTLRRVHDLKLIVEHVPVAPDKELAVGRALKCDAVLFVQGESQGDRFRIHIQATNSVTGVSLWDEAVTGRVTDTVWVDTNVSEIVARRFNVSSDHLQRQRLNNQAFREYMRGRYFWNKRNPSDLREAFLSFRAAIRDDPSFALAYAGLAQTYAVAGLHDPTHENEETYHEGKDAAEHAIAIDPNLASAHAALAQILRNYERDMPAAEREYLKAIQLDGNDATAHQWYAEFLAIDGRGEEASAEIDRAHELDPLSAVITAVCGTIRLEERRYAESLPFAEEALRLDPHYYSTYDNVASAMEGLGRYAEAFNAIAKEAEVSGDSALAAAVRAERVAFARGGPRALFGYRLKRILVERSLPGRQYNLAKLYCQLGERERCVAALRQALAERGELVTYIKIDPAFDSIHNDPRYSALVVKFGFTPDSKPHR